MRTHTRSLLIATLTAALLVPWASGVALASCVPGRSNNHVYYYVGRIQTQSFANGVVSRLSTYSPYVNSGGISYAWVMLPGSGNFQWAQIGNYAVSGGVRRTTVQYAWSSSQIHQVDLAAQSVGSYHYHQVFRDANALTPHWYFRIDGANVYNVIFDYWAPSGAQIEDEINTASTQMMGATATGSHQRFLENQIYYSGAWHGFTGSANNSNSTWFGSSGTAANFDTWDKACET